MASVFWIVAGAAALGAAWWVEHIEELVPCALCLLERWPYRVLVLLGVLGLVVAGAPRPLRLLWSLLVVLTLLSGVVLAGTHVGVEQHWWPDPLPQCAAPHLSGGSAAERLRSMPLRPAKPCDSPTPLFSALPSVSMATFDLLYAGLLLVVAVVGVPAPEPRRRFRRQKGGF
ncbi:MAG: disulfide bond formation protein B [Gluconacetobacter diazotrophicus]|nr:disulfide bond formation protein B [Gluconacetobacter diazotrophicus]